MTLEFDAAILRQPATGLPYAKTTPLQVERISLTAFREEEVLVEVSAASLCRSDLSVINGVRAWPMPIVPGHEASGVVQEVGSAVTTVRPGDHVVLIFQAQCGTCPSCAAGEPHLCGPGLAANRLGELLGGGTRLRSGETKIHHHMGLSAFAEYAVVSQYSLVPIPQDLPLEVAALFGCGVMCGAGTVLNTAAINPGDTVAIVGTGGVGSSAILGAKAAGAGQIIAIDTDQSRLNSALRLGATDTILRVPEPQGRALIQSGNAAVDEVFDLSGGGVDCAFEMAGNLDAFVTAFHGTRRGGKVVTLGLVDPKTPFTLDVAALVTSAKTIIGSYIGSCDPRRDIPAYIQMYQNGKLPIDQLITHRHPLSKINTALDHMATNIGLRQIILPGH